MLDRGGVHTFGHPMVWTQGCPRNKEAATKERIDAIRKNTKKLRAEIETYEKQNLNLKREK